MINVTKTFLPPFEEYTAELKRAWDKAWITNNGELVRELETKLKEYLKVDHFLFTNNGTVVLQMALKVLGITKEVITTPFSYVATTNAILWEGCTPVFVDIDINTLCINAELIERSITPDTQAILATHVYGIPCDVERIDEIAKKHKLKVIYDAAHSFGCIFNNRSLLNYGDISTCSFHATKVFHTVEGGCIVSNDREIEDQLMLYRQFGHINDDYISVGVNGKNSEFHAAMGLVNLNYLDGNIEKRKALTEYYDIKLANTGLKKPVKPPGLKYNYSYYPVLLDSESALLSYMQELNKNNIFPRRYFFPSLNNLPFVKNIEMPVSDDISRRVLCLPLFHDLTLAEIDRIVEIFNHSKKDSKDADSGS